MGELNFTGLLASDFVTLAILKTKFYTNFLTKFISRTETTALY